MKIVLFALNSSYTQTNLAVRCIADALAGTGNKVSIVERNTGDKRDGVLFDLYAAKADIYGFSAYIWNIDELLSHAENLKALLPGAKIVFGGPEVSFEDESIFERYGFIDCLICGEGEGAFLSLCQKFPDKQVIRSEAGGKAYDFTERGILYDRFPAHRDSLLYYESSRGCPFHCTYCLSGGTASVRAKSAVRTVSDLLEFERLPYPIRTLKFVDRTFNFDINRANRVWEALLSERFTKKYHFEVCADLLNDESFDILSHMPKGKIQLEVGVQTTNKAALTAISRKTDTGVLLSNISRLHGLENIAVHVDLIAGLPYDGFDDVRRSFNDVYGIADVLQLGFLKLLHGAEMNACREKYGFVFMSRPPYTVLFSDFISFEELMRLRRLASVLDRFSNSGKFKTALSRLVPQASSPFDFFDGLAAFCPPDLTAVSQNKAYELLYSYAAEFMKFDNKIIRSCLHLDYLLSETRRTPEFLRENQLSNGRGELLDSFGVSRRTGEVYAFSFDASAVYVIDREHGRYYRKSVD